MNEEEFNDMYADELEMIRTEVDDDEADELQRYAEECSSITRPSFKSKKSLVFELDEKPHQIQEPTKQRSPDDYHEPERSPLLASESYADADDIPSGDLYIDLKSIESESETGLKKRCHSDEAIDKDKTDVEERVQKKMKLNIEDQVNSDLHGRGHPTKIGKGTTHRRVPEGDFISIRNSIGSVSYASLISDEQLKKGIASLVSSSSSSSCHASLLSVPVSIMKILLHEQQQKKKEKLIIRNGTDSELMMNSDSYLHGNNDSYLHGNTMEANEGLDDDDGSGCEKKKSNANSLRDKKSNERVETHLWVDKHAPRRYSDLISEESTNRSLLRWLKLWDYTCFGKELVHAKNNYTNNSNNINGEMNGTLKNNNMRNNMKKNNNLLNNSNKNLFEELDKNKRPVHKVALISGPPGLGKTTLAHVVARHAGYNVVEMNASDDRSVEIFREKIESSTQMRSVLSDINPKPNCLVIDEIDGAPQPAIDVLLNMIKKSDPNTSTTSNTTATTTTTKTARKKHEFVLLRPIICICNDLYVPSLRLLKQHCCLLTFHPSVTSVLAERLMEICKAESLHSDLTTLMALCEKADNDVRSCINTLQFVKAKHGDELNLRTVTSLKLGQKDVHRSLLNVWQAIFTLPKLARKRYVNPHDRLAFLQQLNEQQQQQENNSSNDRFNSILQIVGSTGEDAKIQQGLFDNYLITNVKDPRMDTLLEAIDWLCYADLMDVHQLEHQDYSVMRYAPFLPAAMHLLFAVNRPHKIVFPKSQFEFHTNYSRRNELLNSVIQSIHPSIRPFINNNNMVMDLLPYINEVIKPTLRPVNVQLYTSQEKESLSQVVQVMLSYNLSYKQNRSADGQYVYDVEPNIDDVVHFGDAKSSKQMSYGCKQLIAREIEMEKMRRMEKLKPQNVDVGTQPAVKPPSKSFNRLNQKLQPKPFKPTAETKVHVDFFGRKIEKKQEPNESTNKMTSATSTSVKKSVFGQVWYKYKEGFTNAVRRSVRVVDFL